MKSQILCRSLGSMHVKTNKFIITPDIKERQKTGNFIAARTQSECFLMVAFVVGAHWQLLLNKVNVSFLGMLKQITSLSDYRHTFTAYSS